MHDRNQIIFQKLAGFHFLFCLGQTFPMNIFLLPILASDIKTIKIMLTVCFTNDVTHHRRALAEISKGQLISKAIYGLLTSPKKRTDEFVLFAFLLCTANK